MGMDNPIVWEEVKEESKEEIKEETVEAVEEETEGAE